MESVFSIKDFAICDVPVPKGYPQSQTHAGVAVYGGRVFLTTSPFPQIKHSRFMMRLRALLYRVCKGKLHILHGDMEENPMLYWGTKGEEVPSKFTPFIGNPLVNLPPSLFGFQGYNSDPDIYIEDGILYVVNREYIALTKPGTKHYVGDSLVRLDMIKFAITGDGIEYRRANIFKESYDNILSPSLTKVGEKYCIFYIDTYSYLYPDSHCNLWMMRDDKIDGCYEEKNQIKIASESFVPWHLSVFSSGDKLYAIVACVKKGKPKRLYQMLGEFSDDLSALKIYQMPLVDIPSYRGSAYITSSDKFVLYSTTDRYPLKGSKSVDGKDVIVMQKPFTEVLSLLKQFEQEEL